MRPVSRLKQFVGVWCLVPPTEAGSYGALTAEIADRADTERRDSSANWSVLRKNQFDAPASHPSLFRHWVEQGGEKFQKLFSRHSEMTRFGTFVRDLERERGLEALALFRAKINPIATVPLTILPNKPDRQFANDAFQWYLNDRVGLMQPSARSISAQDCNCRFHPIIGDSNGRHFRTCPKNNLFTRFHDKMRDVLIKMCLAAGLTVACEPKGKLPDEPELRPGDLCISDWTIDGVAQTEHCIDFTAPVVNGGWGGLTTAEQRFRASAVGVAGRRREDFKTNNRGSARDQTARGNDFTMKRRCLQQHINFWPVAIEADGACTSSFLHFFKNVCNAAKTLTDQNQSAFKHYWSKRIGCELHQQNARLCLQRTASLRRKLKRLPVTSDDVLQHQQLQTDLPSSVSVRSEYRDRQRHNGAVLRARGLRQRRRLI